MQRKNKCKAKMILGIAGLVGVPLLYNYIVAKMAENKMDMAKSSPKNHYYKWEYGDIHYTVRGEGEPLVLLHSLDTGASKEEWESNISSLSARYKVYAVDWLGYGLSDKPKITYSSYLYVTMLNDFLKDVVQEPAYIIGAGHGADFAVTAYSFNPKSYKKIMLISPNGITGDFKNVEEKNLWIRRIMELPLYGTFIYNIMTSLPSLYYLINKKCATKGTFSWEEISEFTSSSRVNSEGGKFPLASYINNYFNVNIEKQLKEIKIPLYVVWGDTENTTENMDMVNDINPEIQTIYFENTSSFPQKESRKGFYKVCRNFFEE